MSKKFHKDKSVLNSFVKKLVVFRDLIIRN